MHSVAMMLVWILISIAWLAPVVSVSAQPADRQQVIKTVCAPASSFADLETVKQELLLRVKREASNELYGELILATTRFENFSVTSDQIFVQSMGLVRIQGAPRYAAGSTPGEYCVTITAYSTARDRAQFEPKQVAARNCLNEPDMPVREVRVRAEEAAMLKALIAYDRRLGGYRGEQILQLLREVEYTESGFLSDTLSYCVGFRGMVLPIEVTSFLLREESQDEEPTFTPMPAAGSITPAATLTVAARPNLATPTPNAAATIAAAVTATLLAHAEQTQIAQNVHATLTAVAPTSTPTLTATRTPSATPTHTPTPTPPSFLCEVISESLNLRTGPGTEYAPPLANLPRGAQLLATGRNDPPTWITVDVVGAARSGWVSADERFVRCDFSIERLPQAAIPPTPTLAPTPQPLQLSAYTSSGSPVSIQSSDAGGIRAGRTVYSDRLYTYAGAPEWLSGSPYILTANRDKDSVDGSFALTITTNRAVRVYVAHSDSHRVKPSWMNSFVDTGADLTFVDNMYRTVTLSLFAKSYPAGQITLGGNAASGGGSHSMYTVIIQAE